MGGGVSAAQLEKVCRRLGDVVLDPALWPDVIADISTAAGAFGGVLLQSDVRTADVPRTKSIDDLTKAYFRDGWHVRDVMASRVVPLLRRGRLVVTDREVIPSDEARKQPDLNELYLPFGLRWIAVVGFMAGDAFWGLPLQRTPGQGPYEREEARALEVLCPHLTEVANLSAAVGRIALSSATNALNAVGQPAVAIDRRGCVLDANNGAEALFGPYLRVKNRRLVASDAEAQRSLHTLFDRLQTTPETTPLPCDPIIIPRTGGSPLIVRVLPVHGAARTPFLGARALLTFTDVESESGPSPALLTRTFGLTPAEARLASIMSDGLSLERAAEELGISRETARTQLKAIFAKTGTHRQSELVARLARL